MLDALEVLLELRPLGVGLPFSGLASLEHGLPLVEALEDETLSRELARITVEHLVEPFDALEILRLSVDFVPKSGASMSLQPLGLASNGRFKSHFRP